MTVTKQQQLDWLAKNVSRFPDGFHKVFASVYCVGVLVGFNATEKHEITREEWQQERDKMQKQQDNSWFERGELPPVGCECEVKTSNDVWDKAFTVGFDIYGGMVVQFIESKIPFSSCAYPSSFRPLRAESEKAIDAACEAIGGVIGGRLIIERLYDAGLLKEKNK